MNQSKRFDMRISPQERTILAELARHLERTQADTVRFVMREKWQAMKAKETTDPNTINQLTEVQR